MNHPAARIVASLAIAAASGVAGATDWTGVELAWRNDPRPAADAPLPVDPPSSRRSTRRSQRRTVRRVDAETVVVAPPSPDGGTTVPTAPAAVALPTATMAPVPRTIVHRDQASGDHPRQRFDIHLPDGCSGGGLPLVVWIHGPDWRTGSKADCPVTWLVGQGFAVASLDYRPSDLAVFPAQLDDCRAALDAIRADAATWGIDAARICVAGTGAGGHLAALLAFDDTTPEPIREAAADETDREPLPAIVGVAMFDAPTHLPSLGGQHDRPGSAASRLVGGPLPEFREAAQRASPVVHVSPDDPPALIVQARRSDAVPADQGDRLDAAMHAAGVASLVVVLDAASGDLAPREGTPAAGALLEFLDRTLGPGSTRRRN